MVEILTEALGSGVRIPLANDKVSRSSSGGMVGDLAFHDVLIVRPFGMYLQPFVRSRASELHHSTYFTVLEIQATCPSVIKEGNCISFPYKGYCNRVVFCPDENLQKRSASNDRSNFAMSDARGQVQKLNRSLSGTLHPSVGLGSFFVLK